MRRERLTYELAEAISMRRRQHMGERDEEKA